MSKFDTTIDGVSLRIDTNAMCEIKGRDGELLSAEILAMTPERCSPTELQVRLVDETLDGLGVIRGVEMFCVDQRVGMSIGLLIEMYQSCVQCGDSQILGFHACQAPT